MSKKMQACDGTEKVKRRMIRTIGRLLQEKKPQDEIWEYMKKEFGKKCKVLWDRMRVLTLKKLKCLFNALDIVNNVPKMARMTLTDWLIFDLVLVHEKFDVIDMKSIRDNKPSKVLQNLFSLVLRFEIEGRSGEELANAWIAATVHYNSLGHQCSPMLLQRRWYQLKELTRASFYNFWFIFRGNLRQLNRAKEDSPISELQRDIALRYSNLITQPFIEWKECIKNRTVIMPDEFETKMRNVSLMKPSDLSVPDLVLIEPKISTIDLCDDSDIEEVHEDTTKESVTEKDTQKDTETPKVIELSPVTIKSEPIDLEDDPPQDAQNLENTQAEENDNFDEEIQRLQLVENEIIIDSDGEAPADDRESENHTPDDNEEIARELKDDNEEIRGAVTDDNQTQVTTDEGTVDTLDNAETESQKNNIMEVEDTSDVNQEQSSEIHNDNVNNESVGIEANLKIKSEKIDEIISDNYVENVDQNNETTNQPDLVVKVEKDTLINEANPEATYPVIATISSAGVPVNMDAVIEGHSNNETPMDTDNVTENFPEDTHIDDDFRDNFIIGQSEDSNKIDNLGQAEDKDDSSSEEDIIKLPSSAVKNDVLQYNDVIPHDLEFADDGIQLVDDGIEYDSDEDNNIKTEDEQPKIDQKLLMVPVVYTTKLDHMIVFKQRLLFDGVNQKDVLEKIIIESKPISKLAIKIEPEEIDKSKTEEPKQYEENIFKQPRNDVNVFNKPVMAVNNDELPIKEEPQDFEEDTALESSEDEVEVPRIKPTSYLLRKPRRRSYNPIQLCKNPDFNTRLKRLPVSFFTSQRNRFLLNECKPMTIDVSKAFESKLLNGTLYLTNSGQCSNFTSPVKINNVDTVPTVSVIAPSATPVQSLMDIDKLLEDELKKRMGERNRTINLPDITEVRRINQHLLTAEVTPLRISPAASPVNEDASIVIEDDQAVSRQQGVTENIANKEVILPKIPPNPTIAPSKPATAPPKPTFARPKPETSANAENPDTNNSQNTMSLNKIRKQNRRTIHPPVSWRSTKIRTPIDNSDLLLTTDTLYKMLFAIDPNGVKSSSYNKYVSDNIKNKVVMQKKTIFTPKGQSHKKTEDEPIEVTDDVNEKLEDNKGNKENGEKLQEKQPKAKVKVVYDKTKFVKRRRYCCWASARIDLLNGNTTRCRPHKCREICSCCCKLKLADMIFTNECIVNNANESNNETTKENEDDTLKNACESIESVVQQTRELSQAKPMFVPAATKLSATELDVVKVTASTQVDLTTNDDTPTVDKQFGTIYERNILKSQPPPRPPTLLEKLAEAQAKAKSLKRPPMYTKTIKQLSDPDKTQWTLCPCKRPVLKLSDQRTIVVDGTSICQYHPKTKNSKQGQLYINRKGNNERPIFIGKNKLLLTNVKRPDATSAVPPVSPSLVSVPAAENLQMPEGVQIILLPTGTLTYSVDHGTNLTAEQLSVMPAILAVVQAQINSGNLAILDPNAGKRKDEIKESSDIIGFKEGEQGAVSVERVSFPALETTPSVPVDTINLSNEEFNNTVSPINAEGTSKNADSATPIEPNKTDNTLLSPNKETNAPEAVSLSLKTNKKITEVDEENDDEENKLVIDENIHKNVSTSQEPEANAIENTQKSETNETETATQKNRASLLSDLMEMSGICEEDMVPAAAPVPLDVALSVDVQERTPEGPLLTKCIQSRFIPVPPLSPLSQSPKKSDIKDVYANLSTVNSFAELKYAYNNNGLFFKLDLDSGVIVPITLCIKKKQAVTASSKPNTVIDLTDDADEDEKIVFNTENNPTASDNIFASKVFKRVLSEVKTAEQSLNLKRVKPNILKRVHRLTPNQRSLLKSFPGPRKILPKRVDAQIDLVDSDNPMEEEYLQSSNDDTSDDEPLAKKAKRAAEKRANSTPVDFDEKLDSMGDKANLESIRALKVGDGLDLQSLQESNMKDSEIIPAPTQSDSEDDVIIPAPTQSDSEDDNEIIPAPTLSDSEDDNEIIPAPTLSDSEDDNLIIPAPTQSDSEGDSEMISVPALGDSEMIPAPTLGDSKMIPNPTLDASTVDSSAVTLDDPKPTHLVLTRDDHHETVPIDSYYNDDGDDEDSQDCILGV